MFFYKEDYAIEKSLQLQKSDAQICLEKFAGRKFKKNEAEVLWNRIVDHKWYVSERLQRDIGFKTAAVDFFENFYEENNVRKNRNNFFQKLKMPISNYFTAKRNQHSF